MQVLANYGIEPKHQSLYEEQQYYDLKFRVNLNIIYCIAIFINFNSFIQLTDR